MPVIEYSDNSFRHYKEDLERREADRLRLIGGPLDLLAECVIARRADRLNLIAQITGIDLGDSEIARSILYKVALTRFHTMEQDYTQGNYVGSSQESSDDLPTWSQLSDSEKKGWL